MAGAAESRKSRLFRASLNSNHFLTIAVALRIAFLAGSLDEAQR